MGKEYDVGYGKPPVKNQFKKGKSGNPWGRLKLSREKQPLDPKKIAIAALKSLVTIPENGKKKKITAMEDIWNSIVADARKGDKTARKYVVEFMMKLDKLDFEDDGVFFWRMTKERVKATDDYLEEFGQYEITDSNEEQGNGSSSGGVDNQGQGNGSSSGGADNQGQGSGSSSGGADNQKEGSGSSSGGVDNQGQGNSSSSGGVVWIE